MKNIILISIAIILIWISFFFAEQSAIQDNKGIQAWYEFMFLICIIGGTVAACVGIARIFRN